MEHFDPSFMSVWTTSKTNVPSLWIRKTSMLSYTILPWYENLAVRTKWPCRERDCAVSVTVAWLWRCSDRDIDVIVTLTWSWQCSDRDSAVPCMTFSKFRAVSALRVEIYSNGYRAGIASKKLIGHTIIIIINLTISLCSLITNSFFSGRRAWISCLVTSVLVSTEG